MSDTHMTSVPVKIDASALAEALSKANAQAQTNYIDPAPFISSAGTRIGALYTQYLRLNKIAATLHGKKVSDPLPSSLRIEKISIKFSVTEGDNFTSDVADIYNVACIADIAQLLSTELGAIIYSIEQEAKSVADIASKTTETCAKARTEWEAANPDRKIVRTDLVSDSGDPIGTVADPQVVVNSPK